MTTVPAQPVEPEAPDERPGHVDSTGNSGGPAGAGVRKLFGLWPIAIIGWASLVIGRAIAPSVAGIAVGIDSIVEWFDYASAMLAHLFALTAGVAMGSLIAAVARSQAAVGLRISSIALGAPVILLSLSAAVLNPRPASLGAAGLCVSLLAILCVAELVKNRGSKAVAVAFSAAGFGTLFRVVAYTLASIAYEQNSPDSAGWARGMATVSFVLDMVVIGAAVTWLVAESPRLMVPVMMGVLGLCLMLTRVTLLAPDSPGWEVVLISRASERLLARPEPFIPLPFDLFVATLAVISSALALMLRRNALGAAIALVLLVRSQAEVPSQAMMLAVGALALVLLHPPVVNANVPIRATTT